MSEDASSDEVDAKIAEMRQNKTNCGTESELYQNLDQVRRTQLDLQKKIEELKKEKETTEDRLRHCQNIRKSYKVLIEKLELQKRNDQLASEQLGDNYCLQTDRMRLFLKRIETLEKQVKDLQERLLEGEWLAAMDDVTYEEETSQELQSLPHLQERPPAGAMLAPINDVTCEGKTSQELFARDLRG